MNNREKSTMIDFAKYKASKKNEGRIVEKTKEVESSENSKRICVFSPIEFTDTKCIVDELLAGNTVIIQLTPMDQTVAEAIMNFIFGACYALGGKVCAAAPNVYVLEMKEAIGKNIL